MASALEQSVQERAYIEIRARLLRGDYRLRERLDATAIAADLGMSSTPVREALVRLTAERVIVMRRAKGFYVALWTEAQLRALYQWRGELAKLAVRCSSRFAAPVFTADQTYADRVRAVLSAGQEDVNPELARAAINADDRLHRVRAAELEVWADAEDELAALAVVIVGGDRNAAETALEDYHSRRMAAAKDIRECAAILELPPNGA